MFQYLGYPPATHSMERVTLVNQYVASLGFFPMGYSKKKQTKNKQTNRRVEDMENAGTLEEVKFPWVNQKQHGVSRGDQEKSCAIFEGLGFKP